MQTACFTWKELEGVGSGYILRLFKYQFSASWIFTSPVQPAIDIHNNVPLCQYSIESSCIKNLVKFDGTHAYVVL